jgi:hypothetical protein
VNGTWALICPGDTKNNGAWDAIESHAGLPQMVGRGTDPAMVVDEAKFEPKMAAREPGATARPTAKLAPFTTPFAEITGGFRPEAAGTISRTR